jgi:hypothetical protein
MHNVYSIAVYRTLVHVFCRAIDVLDDIFLLDKSSTTCLR